MSYHYELARERSAELIREAGRQRLLTRFRRARKEQRRELRKGRAGRPGQPAARPARDGGAPPVKLAA